MPTYPTPHIEWKFNLPASPTDDRASIVSDNGLIGDAYTYNLAALADQIVGDSAFLSALGTAIDEAADLAAVTSSCTVTLNGDGYIEIANTGDPIYLHRSGLWANLGMSDTQDPLLIADGAPVVLGWHPRWMWHPRMVTQRDTGEVPRNITITSETSTENPTEVSHSDDWYIRVIRWQTVAACLIHNHRAIDANFAQAAPKATGDTHNTLEALVNYIRNDESDSSEHPNVWVAEEAGGYRGPYRINLTKSKLAGGIKDENMLYTETAMESYTVELYMRKQ